MPPELLRDLAVTAAKTLSVSVAAALLAVPFLAIVWLAARLW